MTRNDSGKTYFFQIIVKEKNSKTVFTSYNSSVFVDGEIFPLNVEKNVTDIANASHAN